MPSCSYCVERGRPRCRVSPLESDRCQWCVRDNQSRCDVLGVTAAQLRDIADRHSKLESELEKAEELAVIAQQRVIRLRKSKKLWFEKMKRAIARGIDSVEELEKVEREESEALSAATADPILGVEALDWNSVDFSVLSEPVPSESPVVS